MMSLRSLPVLAPLRVAASKAAATALLSLVLLATANAEPARALQQGTVEGQVTDARSGEPVVSALISAENEDGRTVGSVMTNREGRYRLELPAGSYRIAFAALGFAAQESESVQVTAGGVTTVNFQSERRAFEMNPVVVSVQRLHEKAITAPARVEVIGAEEIRARPTITPVDHLRTVPGFDVITQGIQSTNIVVRGFNNIFSGALHTLTDNRIAGVPSLRVNVMSFVPSDDEDIERMEIVLGPGAALYGPNTADGVLHILTRSPLTESGSTVSVMGGEKNVFGANFRTSHLLTGDFGIKVSGRFMNADEWEYRDPVEQEERAKFDDPELGQFWREDLIRAIAEPGEPREVTAAEADRRIARVAARDFDVSHWAGEIRADWAVTDEATAIFSTGVSRSGSQIELTGLGAAQVEDWQYTYYQARFTWRRLFAQAYTNRSDAGTTFLLRNGAPIVDRSNVVVGQIQHGMSPGARQRFTYGLDYIATNPETEGTINGIYEDEDDTREFGAYLQSETQLTGNLDLVLAGRVDTHSALPDAIFSPRAALVFEPRQDQALRLTYNRAFSTPSSLNQFLDLGTPIPDPGAARLGYSVRVQGTGTEGFRFRQADGSYLMRSPFTPEGLGGPAQLLPAEASAFWAAAVQVVASQVDPENTQLHQVLAYLQTLQPTPEQIGSNYLNTATEETGSLADLDLRAIDPIRESTQSTWEVGYKGIIAERTVLAADVWYSRRSNMVTPLTPQTPFVLMNPEQIGAFMVPRLMEAGMSQEEAQATAAGLVPQLAQIPVGVISSPDVNANGAQLLTTYVNVDEEIDLYGVDLSAQFLLTDRLSLAGTLSLVNDDSFVTDGGLLVALNAPKRKGSLSLGYRDPADGISGEIRGRFHAGHPANSGVFVGEVDSHTLFDMNVSYAIPAMPGATAQLSVQNLLDSAYRSFPGVPEVGRMALVRLRYEF